jgi:UDP-glucuronate 4-epimerase
MKKILVTGSSGFIGSELVMSLLKSGHQVFGVDNHNDYYDVSLKEARLSRFVDHPNYKHFISDIADSAHMELIFASSKPEIVVNLAAQAGVRFSLEKPMQYIQSNIVGFSVILELCRLHQIKHLIYASTSSVYGDSRNLPFSEYQSTDRPLSLYAATKKSNEAMAHSYSHLFGLPTTGLRFFTVYGPWGRPDMALFKFTRQILADEPIQLFNGGNHKRDFTYIDDIVFGLNMVINHSFELSSDSSQSPARIYNMGNGQPVNLIDYITEIEVNLQRTAEKIVMPAQPGDMLQTYADTSLFDKTYGHIGRTQIQEGVGKFISWYKDFYS